MLKLRRLMVCSLMILTACLLAACGPEVPVLTPQDLTTSPAIGVVGTLAPTATPWALLTPSSALVTPTAVPTPTYALDDETEPPADYAALIKRFTDEDKNAVVLMGKFTEYLREDNAIRQYKDMSKPDTDFWNGVKVYTFTIESVLKGSVKPKTVEIALLYRDENLKLKQPSQPNPNFIEPVLNDQTYIIPLIYDKDLKWYINDMGIEPIWFKVVDDKLVYDSVNKSVTDKWSKIDPITVSAFKKLLK